MKFELSRDIFEKYSNIKLHENPSSGNGGAPYGRADMTKLVVAFRNFAIVPTNTRQSGIKKTARNLRSVVLNSSQSQKLKEFSVSLA
jgi:hypothetical protein